MKTGKFTKYLSSLNWNMINSFLVNDSQPINKWIFAVCVLSYVQWITDEMRLK